jgi:hypothetical protein
MNQQKSNGGEDGGAQWCRYLHGALWRRVKAPASGGAGEGGRGEEEERGCVGVCEDGLCGNADADRWISLTCGASERALGRQSLVASSLIARASNTSSALTNCPHAHQLLPPLQSFRMHHHFII